MDNLKRRIRRTPLDEDIDRGDANAAPLVSQAEDLEQSQNAEALKQDPDAVPNRLQEPEPPEEEEVGL